MTENKNFLPNPLLGEALLPADIVLAPEWWFRHEGITFDPDFFFHPLKRVEAEKKMEKVLYERWGHYGLGQHHDEVRPEIGAVHLAAGFLVSEMMGCEVRYSESHPPQVVAANLERDRVDPEETFRSEAFRRLEKLIGSLEAKYGYLTGDINWGGILNLAMDRKGENILTGMMTDPGETRAYLATLAEILERFTAYMQRLTGSTSVSVNRGVRHLRKPVMLHSECSHTMLSAEDYEAFLLPFDLAWSRNRPFGIHYCGADPHRMAASFAKIPHLDFLDVGWGGDVELLRRHLPHTFLNLRLSPVEISRSTPAGIRDTVTRLVRASGNPYLTGICCINMDDAVTDAQINAIFETVDELRKEYAGRV